MNAVDTNLLVYAHREECQWHPQARDCLSNLAASPVPWAIPWPCVHEFLAIATHPRIYDPPTPTAIALDQVAAWLETPNLVLLAESPGYWDKLGLTSNTAQKCMRNHNRDGCQKELFNT